MRLLHTSDWHLGRVFRGVGLLPAQAQYVDHLVETVRAERVEAVLISGDVYDRAMPAPETVALLSEAVVRLIDAGAQVVISSGNHDSAIRLGFASDLLARAGLHIRTSLGSVGRPVLVGGAALYALPYLEPSVAADPLGAGDRTHAGVLRAAMGRVSADAAGRVEPVVVMAHAFVTGGESSESERDISAGGVSAVPLAVFGGADYVALGHLHGRQRLSDRVRYSGSPVAMSFSEVHHVKGSWLVDLAGRGERPEVEMVAAPVHRPLAVLRGGLTDLLTSPGLSGAQGSYCHVTLTDAIRPLGAMEAVRRRFQHTLGLEFDPQGATVTETLTYGARVASREDLTVCADFVRHVRGGYAVTDAERAMLRAALEGSRVEAAAATDEGMVAGVASPEVPARGVA